MALETVSQLGVSLFGLVWNSIFYLMIPVMIPAFDVVVNASSWNSSPHARFPPHPATRIRGDGEPICVVVCEHMSRGMNDRHRVCVAEPGVCFLVRRVFDFMYDLDFILRL